MHIDLKGLNEEAADLAARIALELRGVGGVTIPKRKLGELGEFRNGLNYSKENFGSGLKVISVKDFGDRWRPDLTILDEISPAGMRIANSNLQRGDIIFVRSNGNKELIG